MPNDLPKIFISYSHKDEKLWKDRLLKHLGVLEKQGRLTFWDDRQIAIGQDWLAQIEAALRSAEAAILLISPDFLNSKFILSQEVPQLLQRRSAEGMQVFPVLIRSCNWQSVEWLRRMQLRPTDGKPLAKYKGDGIDEVLAALVAEIDSLLNQTPIITPPPIQPAASPDASSLSEPPPDQEGVRPYLGLSAFRERDAGFFFGRDSFVHDVWERTLQRPLVAVVGPSGSGKSSVVQAGLLPLLRESKKPVWEAAIFTPGDAPFRKLAEALVRIEEPGADRLKQRRIANQRAKDLASGEVTILDAVEIALEAQRGADRLLLIADQFEELFTQTLEADRKAFAAQLIEAARSGKATVVLTLRADFYGQAISLSTELSKLIEQGVVNHRPLDEADLRAVIVKPALRAGLQFDAELVEEVLAEVTSHPDSLPLLEYALTEMWRRRSHNAIGHEQYKAIGKIAGAINRRADEVLSSLPAEQQEPALRALTRLVRVSISEEDGAATRLRLPVADFSPAEQTLLEEFVKERLLVKDRNPLTNEETVEVAHEALIRQWEKLRAALDKDREFLSWRRRLGFRMEEWERSGRDEWAVLRGTLLDEAKGWLERREADINAREKLFITWTEQPEYQVEQILSQAPHLILLSYRHEQQNWFAALTFCLGSQVALTAARAIDPANSRALALRAIAQALNEAGRLDEALTVAREIDNAEARASTLRSIAQALSKADRRVEAKLAFDDALTAARAIRDFESRASALSEIAQAFSKAGWLNEAEFAFGDALTAARAIDDFESRAPALSEIAQALGKAGRLDKAKLAFGDALTAARTVDDFGSRVSALGEIVQALSKAGRRDEARLNFDEVLSDARATDDPMFRAYALSSIAQALCKVGWLGEAKLTFDESLAAARAIDTAFLRAPLLSQIAQALSEAGQLDEALTLARAIKEDDSDASLFSNSAEILSKIAQALSKAGRLDEALTLIRVIDGLDSRASALSDIAQTFSEAGRLNEAKLAFDEALTTARMIDGLNSRASALSDIAQTFSKAGRRDEALAVARTIENAYSRASALSTICHAWLDSNLPEKTSSLVDEVQAALVKIYNEDNRSKVAVELAEILARLKRFHEAREMADKYARSSQRLVAYTAILREYHIERNPDLADMFAKLEQSDDESEEEES